MRVKLCQGDWDYYWIDDDGWIEVDLTDEELKAVQQAHDAFQKAQELLWDKVPCKITPEEYRQLS